MESLLENIRPALGRYKIEIILLSTALAIGMSSFIVFMSVPESSSNEIVFEAKPTPPARPPKITVDISGGVKKPGVYTLKQGSRLGDVLLLAEGLSDEAEKNVFGRNFNQSRILSDQEKIYIPFSWEMYEGIFQEGIHSLNPLDNSFLLQNPQSAPSTQNEPLINVNSSSAEELDTLPGVGPATAQKIIDGRPYRSVEELLNKKVVKKNVYESIKDLIIAP